MAICRSGFRAALTMASVAAGLLVSAAMAVAEEPFFDELRFGAQVSASDREDGSFYQLTMFFDPFESELAQGWKEKLLRPRVFIGGTVAGHSEDTSMVFGGFAWDAKVTEKLFVEAGFGGMIHNGNLRDYTESGPYLGCRALFREYAAVGYDVTENWRVLAQLEHSSHANLCGRPNNGITRAGIQIGYKF